MDVETRHLTNRHAAVAAVTSFLAQPIQGRVADVTTAARPTPAP
jgi:hypothetical protein